MKAKTTSIGFDVPPEYWHPVVQADRRNSICFGGRDWGAYLRRKVRPNSFANRESSSVLIIKHVSKDNEGSDSGLITTPSALRPTEAASVTIATPTCRDT